MWEWVTNEAKHPSFTDLMGIDCQRTWREYNNWRQQFKEGPPQKTAKYTSEQLDKMGFVGLYQWIEIPTCFGI